MKALKTLTWLELRATFLIGLILLASTFIWHFVFRLAPSMQLDSPDENIAALGAFILAANVLGLFANLAFLIRAWQSMRNGELQFKLSAATQPMIIVLAQFFVAFLSIALYSFVVTSLGWWHLNAAGFTFSLMSGWSLWLYLQMSFFAPLIALGFFVVSYSTAFHLRSMAWLALLFGIIGFGKFLEIAAFIIENYGYTLLSIPLPKFSLFGEPFLAEITEAAPNALPQELLWIAIIITVASLYVSGRILKEIEL